MRTSVRRWRQYTLMGLLLGTIGIGATSHPATVAFAQSADPRLPYPGTCLGDREIGDRELDERNIIPEDRVIITRDDRFQPLRIIGRAPYINELGQEFTITVTGVNEPAVRDYLRDSRFCVAAAAPDGERSEQTEPGASPIDELLQGPAEANQNLIVEIGPVQLYEKLPNGYDIFYVIDPSISNNTVHNYHSYCGSDYWAKVWMEGGQGAVDGFLTQNGTRARTSQVRPPHATMLESPPPGNALYDLFIIGRDPSAPSIYKVTGKDALSFEYGDPRPRGGMPTSCPGSPYQYFSATSHSLEGDFFDYWHLNGDLPVFGYPINDAQPEINADTGQEYWTQWLERNRFEVHPENNPPYRVLLGLLGKERLAQLGRSIEAPEAGPKPGCLWFKETGHNVCNQGVNLGFKTYWESHGLKIPGLDRYGRSLQLFGLPLTSPHMETNSSGDTVLTQWFERARFEWHPGNSDEYKVLLGLLGKEVHGP